MSKLFDLPFEEDDRARERQARRVLSVTELNVRIRERLETDFFEVWVEGELSNCKVWNTGHLYFTLKDRAAQIRGVVFRSALRYLRFKPADGLRVVARGRPRGEDPRPPVRGRVTRPRRPGPCGPSPPSAPSSFA